MGLLLLRLMTALDLIPDHPACEAVYPRYEIHANAEDRFDACNGLAWEADWMGLDVPLTVELAWSESRFIPKAVNKTSGCSGILQAAPRFWCPNGKREGCDLQQAGLRALAHYLGRHKSEEKAICHFKAGNVCTPLGLRQAKGVMYMTRLLRGELKRQAEGDV